MQLVLLGAPGSGKGTQAKRMVAEYGLVHISTGDMLRQEIVAGSDLGAVIESYLKAGYLVPDHHATSLVDQRLAKADIANGFILDGFPRTVRQAESLDEILRIREIRLDTAALIDVPDEIVVKRISGRRIDPQTGRIYNLGDIAADQAPADVLSRLQKRDDDDEEVIPDEDWCERRDAPLCPSVPNQVALTAFAHEGRQARQREDRVFVVVHLFGGMRRAQDVQWWAEQLAEERGLKFFSARWISNRTLVWT